MFVEKRKRPIFATTITARMAELVDAHDSNSCSIGVWVRFPLRVHKPLIHNVLRVFYFNVSEHLPNIL